MMSRLRCLLRHDDVVIPGHSQAVITCRRCRRQRVVPQLGEVAPPPSIPEGCALIDEWALAELRVAWLVEQAYQGIDPW